MTPAEVRALVERVRSRWPGTLPQGLLAADIEALCLIAEASLPRPIVEAPRDGTRFIAHEPCYGAGSCFWQTVTSGCYADEVETVSGWRIHGMLIQKGECNQPTVWWPLPVADASQEDPKP